jgi:hypothetical protein
MDLSRYGPSVNPYGPPPVNPLAAALASGPGSSSSGYGGGPSSPGANPNGMMPSIPGLPPGMMPLPSASPSLAIGATGVPQIPGAVSPGAAVAPLQGGPPPAIGLNPNTGPAVPPPLAPVPSGENQLGVHQGQFGQSGPNQGPGAPFGFGGLQVGRY